MNQDLGLNLHLNEIFEAACINRILTRLDLEEKVREMQQSEKLINELVKRKLVGIRDSLLKQGMAGLKLTESNDPTN